MFDRESCIYTLKKYERIICVVNNNMNICTRTFIGWNDEQLNEEVYFQYKYLKQRLCDTITTRYKEYIWRRENRKGNSTIDKEFFRFMTASGFSEINLLELPINRLIKIYSVYFKKVGDV